MEEKWLKYLSETKDERLVPLMERYFNGNMSINELNGEIQSLGYIDFYIFRKEYIINDILNS